MPGFNIETPQEVLSRLSQTRDQQIATNNPLLMQKAVFGQVLDNVFGNPEVRKAQMVQTKIKDSLSGMPAGLGEVDSELYRLRSMRDALVDAGEIDKASQVNMQLLAIGQQKLEQDKLRADTARITNEETRAQGKYPLEIAKDQVDLTQNAAEVETWMNPKTADMKPIAASDTQGKARLMAEGYVPAGKPTLTGSKSDVSGMTKPTITDLQKSIVTSQNQLDNLAQIAGKYDPSFLQYGTKLKNWTMQGLDKIGFPLGADQRAGLQKYISFRTQSVSGLNQYIHDLTGAQMSMYEADRLRAGIPDPDNDSPEVFISKMRETFSKVIGIQKRAQQALASGGTTFGDSWDSVKTPTVSDAEVDGYLSSKFGIPARGSSGAASSDGWVDMGNGVRVRQKQ